MGDSFSFSSSQAREAQQDQQQSEDRGLAMPPPGLDGGQQPDELYREMPAYGTSTYGHSTYGTSNYGKSTYGQSTYPQPLQRQMTVGAANDPLEQEADEVADRVMRDSMGSEEDEMMMQSPMISRMGMGEEDEEMMKAPEISRMAGDEEEMQYKTLQRNLAGMDDAEETLGYTHAFEKMDEEESMGKTTSVYMDREATASPDGGVVSNDVAQQIGDVRMHTGPKRRPLREM